MADHFNIYHLPPKDYPTLKRICQKANLKIYALAVPLSHLLLFKVVCIINQAKGNSRRSGGKYA